MSDDSQVSGAPDSAAAAQTTPQPTRNVKREAADAVRKFLLEDSLYKILEGDEEFIEAVDEILNGDAGLEFDLYCMVCNQVTPWVIKSRNSKSTGGGTGFPPRYSQIAVPSVRVVNAVCLRRQHFYIYIIHRLNMTAQKIGQRPSMADIAQGELKSIAGVDKTDRRELGRALGLFSHDTPLGAFVYLRRVFERMIDRAHERHREKNGTDIEHWSELRMGERVASLSSELPTVVSTNYAVWGLLSKGIHELSDEDAETLFPLVKAVIFEMLGEEERHRQADRARGETRKALQEATTRYGSKKA